MMARFKSWLRSKRTSKAYNNLAEAMREDPGYAHSWLCNIAMPIYDNTPLSLEESNRVAQRLMKHLFDVTTP